MKLSYDIKKSALEGITQEPKDDLESKGYVVFYFELITTPGICIMTVDRLREPIPSYIEVLDNENS